jgi:hypothetical protein
MKYILEFEIDDSQELSENTKNFLLNHLKLGLLNRGYDLKIEPKIIKVKNGYEVY